MTTAKQMALDALKLSSSQNGCDMLLTNEELRECENAIAALETELAAPQAEDINAEFLEALTLMMFDKHGKEWRDSTVDQGVWDDRLERGKSIARAAIARATGAAK